MNVIAVLVAVVIVMWACSPALAVLIGRSIRLADRLESPAVRVGGEDPAHSGARHLRAVK